MYKMFYTVFSTCFSVHGGELFERIVAEEYLMEEDAVDYVRQILEALQFMHERHIVHLDLKVTRTFLSVLPITPFGIVTCALTFLWENVPRNSCYILSTSSTQST